MDAAVNSGGFGKAAETSTAVTVVAGGAVVPAKVAPEDVGGAPAATPAASAVGDALEVVVAVSTGVGCAEAVASSVSTVGAVAVAVVSVVVSANPLAAVCPVGVEGAVVVPEDGEESVTSSCLEGDWKANVVLLVDVALVGLEGEEVEVVNALEELPWFMESDDGCNAPAGHQRSG